MSNSSSEEPSEAARTISPHLRSSEEQVTQLCGVSRCCARNGDVMRDIGFVESVFAALRTIRSLLGMSAILDQIGSALLFVSKYLFCKKFFSNYPPAKPEALGT